MCSRDARMSASGRKQALQRLLKTVIYSPPACSAAPVPHVCRLAWWRCPHAPAGLKCPRAGCCSRGREPNARQDVPDRVVWLPAEDRKEEFEESLIGHDRDTQRLMILLAILPPQKLVHNEPRESEGLGSMRRLMASLRAKASSPPRSAGWRSMRPRRQPLARPRPQRGACGGYAAGP